MSTAGEALARQRGRRSARCGLLPGNRRLLVLLSSTTYARRLTVLRRDAEGDQTLADVFAREGDPSLIEVVNANPGGMLRP